MSVLKNKRRESKAEYLNTANNIYTHTLTFVSKLSSRYARLIGENVMDLAGKLLDECETANSIFPSDELRRNTRKYHLLEARGALLSLDVKLSHVYEILNLNPQGAFTTSTGKTVDSSTAMKRLDNMAIDLGTMIDEENAMLTKLINAKYKDK